MVDIHVQLHNPERTKLWATAGCRTSTGVVRCRTLPARCPVYIFTPNPREETIIRKLMLGIVGAAAVAASLLLMRQQSQPKEAVAEAESASGAITLERMRELGL